MSGGIDDCESLLGGFVADRTRLCDIMFPEGDTTTSEFELVGARFALLLEAVDSVGEGSLPSIGVGGVMKVVGASDGLRLRVFNWVLMRFGCVALSNGLPCVSSPI